MVGLERVQYRAPHVGGQQSGVGNIVLAPTLRQQHVGMLSDRMLYRPLNLRSQAAFAAETLKRGAVRQAVFDQPIERVISVIAEQGYALRLHG
ncbi:hypothetical protein D3C80_1810380 [compost metagenome]